MVVRYGMYNTLPLHLAPHHSIPPYFTLHHFTSESISDIIPSYHIIPRHAIISSHHIAHFILHQHLLQHTLPLCNTIFQIAPYQPHYASHHISHCTPFHKVIFHITPHSMYSTPRFTHFACHSISCIVKSFHHI